MESLSITNVFLSALGGGLAYAFIIFGIRRWRLRAFPGPFALPLVVRNVVLPENSFYLLKPFAELKNSEYKLFAGEPMGPRSSTHHHLPPQAVQASW